MNTESLHSLKQSYDNIPYTSKVFSHCQPTRLHALAKIKGLTPPPLETATVLEIGCSFGGNLLPFAIKYPQSQIIGVDLSEKQINVGTLMMKEIGVENIELIAGDITEITLPNIKFDYIICHGVFSWVPDNVQNAILATIENSLSAHGIAFISYNTYPGWHLQNMAKELMLFGSNSHLDPYSRVEQSFEMLKYTKNILNRVNKTTFSAVSHIFDEITEKSKYYITHEYFEDYNIPLYFKDFNKKIKNYNLAYVTDSNSPNIKTRLLFTDEEYAQICQYFDNNVENIEQYCDFITERKFRVSVITKKENISHNDINIYDRCHSFSDIYIKSNFKYIEDKSCWEIINSGITFSDNNLISKLITAIPENTLVSIYSLLEKLKNEPDYNETTITNTLFYIIHSNNTYLCFNKEPLKKYSEKPYLPPKKRNLIKFVKNNPNIVTLFNQFNEVVILDDFTQYLCEHMNGKNTINDLITIIRNDIDNNVIEWKINEKILTNIDINDCSIHNTVIQTLNSLFSNGFFNDE